jgi:transposase
MKTEIKHRFTGAVIFETEAGKNMPVDADTVEPEDDEYEPPRHVSHFATCPQSAQHRRPRSA